MRASSMPCLYLMCSTCALYHCFRSLPAAQVRCLLPLFGAPTWRSTNFILLAGLASRLRRVQLWSCLWPCLVPGCRCVSAERLAMIIYDGLGSAVVRVGDEHRRV